MIITQISPQKRNKKRMNVFLDGEFSFSLDKELIIVLRLKENQSLTKEQVIEILKENELDKWYGRSLRFLSFRPRSEKEILDYLKKNEVGENLTQIILEKLKRYKLVNDEAFTKWLIEQRQGRSARSKRVIIQELKTKGIAKEMIDETLTEQMNPESELENATKIAVGKMRTLKRETRQKRRAKLTGFLLRRGFGWEIIKQVLPKCDLEVEENY
jgi:regulatory protein